MPRQRTEFAIFSKFQDASGSTSEGPQHGELWEDYSHLYGRASSTDKAKQLIKKHGEDLDGHELLIVSIRWQGNIEVERSIVVRL